MLHVFTLIYLYSALAMLLEYPVLKYIYTHDATAVALAQSHHFDISREWDTILFSACIPLLNTLMACQTLLVIIVCALFRK